MRCLPVGWGRIGIFPDWADWAVQGVGAWLVHGSMGCVVLPGCWGVGEGGLLSLDLIIGRVLVW